MSTIVRFLRNTEEKREFLNGLEGINAITKAAARNAQLFATLKEKTRVNFSHIALPWKESFGHWTKNLSVISEQIRQASERFKDDALWLLSFGWPVPLHAPAVGISRLREQCRNLKPKDTQKIVDKEIIDFYTPERIRSEVLNLWESKPFLRKRMPILRSVIDAHVRSEYACSVPTLLTQIDGVIAESFNHQGFLSWKKFLKYIETLVPDNKGFADTIYRQIIFGELLDDFIHGQISFPDLNRHAILHGVDTRYVREKVSLKAILLFDFLVDQIAFVRLEESCIYHRPECYRIRKSRKPRIIYPIQQLADAEGNKPCRFCCEG